MDGLAPVVLFTYNRLAHTKQTIEALQNNVLSQESELFIYSDGYKNEKDKHNVLAVRKYLKTIHGFQRITIIEQTKNKGLAASIISGVTDIINKYGKIIVLEDDIVTSPYFLEFMNKALDFYENKKQVWHVSGWNYPIGRNHLDDVFVWRVMNCWGWSTWKDRWQYYDKNTDRLLESFSQNELCRFNLDGVYDFWSQILLNKSEKIDTWAIFWYATIFKNNGLCLNPTQTFVENIGHDGSGLNCIENKNYLDDLRLNSSCTFTNKVVESQKYVSMIKLFLEKGFIPMNIDLEDKNLTKFEKTEIKALLDRQDVNIQDGLKQMWHLLDLVWDDYGCDNKSLNWEKISKFYNHPVWILNGLFIEQHDVSMAYRLAIASWVIGNNFNNVIDYGGGFGTLARLIAKRDHNINVHIYEPHPSKFGMKRLAEYQNIHITNKIGAGFDCLISTDVLEHVPDPLQHFAEMINSVKLGGYLILANCFDEVIKCHLPSTFHLKYTFEFFAKIMGLRLIEKLEEGYVQIYKLEIIIEHDWSKIEAYEIMSKDFFSYIKIPARSIENQGLSFNKELGLVMKKLDVLKNTEQKFVIYGAGTGADLIIGHMSNSILFLLDIDETKHNQHKNGFPIYGLEKTRGMKSKIIVSLFGREEDVIFTLHQKYGVPVDNILVLW